MRLKKKFGQIDSATLLACVCFPPLGLIAASRKRWVSSAIAMIAVFLYGVAMFGFVTSGYPRTLNDIVMLNALWGIVVNLAVGRRYLASKTLIVMVNLALLLLLGYLITRYTPWKSLDCILSCKAIALSSLGGNVIQIVPGFDLALFLTALYALFGIAIYVSVCNVAE
ncbi:hypothetical protein AAKU55_000850 [Oxalobacteraceae bacterium GrIS 1.11]